MNVNFNKVPDDSALPDSITVEVSDWKKREVPAIDDAGNPKMIEENGVMVPEMVTETDHKMVTVTKKPIHVHGVHISDDATEPSYNVLCSDGSREIIPLSAFKKTAAPVPPVTEDVAAPGADTTITEGKENA